MTTELATLLLGRLQAELQAAVEVLEPALKGYRDFARLALDPASTAPVAAATAAAEGRAVLLRTALEALQALARDSYPDSPVQRVPSAVHRDLDASLRTLQAAFERFAPQVRVEISAERPTPPYTGASGQAGQAGH